MFRCIMKVMDVIENRNVFYEIIDNIKDEEREALLMIRAEFTSLKYLYDEKEEVLYRCTMEIFDYSDPKNEKPEGVSMDITTREVSIVGQKNLQEIQDKVIEISKAGINVIKSIIAKKTQKESSPQF